MIMKAWAWRLAVVGVAAAVIPACKATPTAAVLLMDTFNNPVLTTNWTLGGTGSVVRDTGNGFTDTTSLRMSGTVTQNATATSKTTFNVTAVTFSVHMAADTGGAAGVGVGKITINDNVGEVASASWDVSGAGTLTLSILGTAVPVASPPSDLSFHRIVFKATSNGNASWSLDNGSPLMSSNSFGVVLPLTLDLSATYPASGTPAPFYFDNVNVTSP